MATTAPKTDTGVSSRRARWILAQRSLQIPGLHFYLWKCSSSPTSQIYFYMFTWPFRLQISWQSNTARSQHLLSSNYWEPQGKSHLLSLGMLSVVSHDRPHHKQIQAWKQRFRSRKLDGIPWPVKDKWLQWQPKWIHRTSSKLKTPKNTIEKVERTTHKMRQNSCKSYIWKGTCVQNVLSALTIQQ